MILMILLLFISQACTDIYVSGLPLMTKEFRTNLSVMNLTITLYVYSQAFFFLFMGVLSDLFGRRRVLISCITAQIIASFIIAYTSSLTLVILLRIIQAMGSGAIYIVLRLVIKDVMNKDEQIHATGMLLIGLVLSPALAPAIGAWIIELSGWRTCFSLIGLGHLILLIWLYILVPETNLEMRKFRNEYSLANHFKSYWHILSDKFFLNLSLIIGGTFASFYGFISISSYMYIDEYHISNTMYSYTFIGIAISYLVGNRTMLWLNQHKVKSWKIIGLGILVSLAGLALMLSGLLFRNNALLILTCVTIGIMLVRVATAFINPPIQVAVTLHFGKTGSHAIGLLSCLQYVFAGAGSAVVSAIPLTPSLSLITSSILFTLVSLAGYYYCPQNQLK